MRILIVSDAWAPQVNGVVTSLQALVAQLRDMGHWVKVISPADFRCLPCPGYGEIGLAWDLWRLGPMIREFRPDCVHIATEGPLAGRAVGMTSYMNIDAAHRRVEIGSTWYRQAVQRSAVNTSCKRLLLAHAFDQLDCIAVEFRTHWFNQASQRAIERLGAKKDGVLRGHALRRDGTIRDTVMYSMRSGEWPEARAQLLYLQELAALAG
jgi:RimJ/RimL family protein N-acetyltransferase